MAGSCVAVVMAACAAGSFHLQGGELAIDWFTISGGAGSSSGGTLEVAGTAGQPALAQASGGGFTLDGGFWTLSTSSSNQPPQLVMPQISSNALSFGFQTVNGQSYTVQTNADLLHGAWGAYTNLIGDGTLWQFSFPLTDGVPRLFFRVAEP